MSIEQLDLMLSDAYKMDVWFPCHWTRRREFEKASYSIWAIDELKRYIAGRLFPRNTGSVRAFVIFTKDFREKMKSLSKIRPNNNTMFLVAMDVSTDVLDILHAMQ